MKLWLQDDVEMYSTHNEGKSVDAEKFIRTLKNKIYKYMTSVAKNIYSDKLDIANKYKTTYHSTINMKPTNVKSNKVDDHVRLSKYKNILANGCTLNRSEEIFVIKKVKNTVPHVINDLNSEEIVETFYENELQKIAKEKSN